MKSLNNFTKLLSKNSPSILTGFAITGVVSTAVLAGRGAIKASVLLAEAEKENDGYLLEPMDVIKTTYKCFIPAIVVGGITVGCILGVNTIHNRRTVALAGAYSLADKAFREYQNKVVETMGENKHIKIRDEVMKDRIVDNPPTDGNIFRTTSGDQLFYDSMSGRYFTSSIEFIRRAQNNINNRMISGEMTASLNDFYYEIGLPKITMGYDLGWSVNTDLIGVIFSTQLTETDKACVVLDFEAEPMFKYGLA